MNVQAAQQVYEQSGLGPEDFQVIELHDCFSANELLLYEALGLCGEGEAPKLIDDNDTTYGGRWVVNPSGGLISKGHPLGATGLAQCTELTWQLRGTADKRQVDNVTAACSTTSAWAARPSSPPTSAPSASTFSREQTQRAPFHRAGSRGRRNTLDFERLRRPWRFGGLC